MFCKNTDLFVKHVSEEGRMYRVTLQGFGGSAKKGCQMHQLTLQVGLVDTLRRVS